MYQVTGKKPHCDSLLRSLTLTPVLGVYSPVSKLFSFLKHLGLNLSKQFYNKLQLCFTLGSFLGCSQESWIPCMDISEGTHHTAGALALFPTDTASCLSHSNMLLVLNYQK